MRWTPGGSDEDIEDRRDDDSSGSGGGGRGFGGFRLGIGGFLVLGVLSFIFKTDLISPFLGTGTPAPVARRAPDKARTAKEKDLVEFVKFVLNDNQKVWTQILNSEGGQYRHAKLVLFREFTRSGCGAAESATGPFYCPADEKVYIDLGFYDELRQKYGAPGDFAQAYVLSHEIGHHVQNIIGIEAKVRAKQRQDPSLRNPLSVKMELQADCFAGIWAHSTAQRDIIQPGDVEEGLAAAAAVGDDRLQKMATGRVQPESFTHGSSADRMRWFQQGYNSGQMNACNTFVAR
jgi:predicted metalloprotease